MTKQLLFIIMFSTGCGWPAVLFASRAVAQEGQQRSDDIENLFKDDDTQAPVEETGLPSPPPGVDSRNEHGKPPSSSQAPSSDIRDVSDLVQLSPFKDVAVISRRFLPKTGRFEIFGGPTAVLNDAFFLNFGVSGRFAYYLQERYGLEFVAMQLTVSERQVTTDLREKRGVTTTSLVAPKNFFGLDFKWTPIYGKMTWLNRKITPFDLYFSIGAGSTSTNQGGNEPTIHLGTGQVFALTKSFALRWDFSWNFYQAKSNVSGAAGGTSQYNNIFLTLGASFFFPEATYR